MLEFHDILPGSSITRVHEEAEVEHADILAATLRLRDAATAALGGMPRSDEAARPTPTAGLVIDNGLLRAAFDTATGAATTKHGKAFWTIKPGRS